MAKQQKHYIGAMTGSVMGLLVGSGGTAGYLEHWEGMTNTKKVNGQVVSVAVHQSFDPKGVITVCKGVTNDDIKNLKPGDVYTRAMCSVVEEKELPRYNAMLTSCLPKDFMVSDHQHVSMLSFVWNVGQGGFCNSSVGRAFRAGNREEGCYNMGKFTRAAGKELPGLENRRYDKFWGEIAWCLRED